MTIHKIKNEFILQASIGELIAALDGIVCAGVTAAKKGADTKTDPIASLGYQAALLSYDVRSDLSAKRIDADKAAFEITEFLNAARNVLAANEDTVLSLPKGAVGGTLKDVVSHIDEILAREDMGAERPAAKFYNGNLQDKFKSSYAPKASKEDLAQPEFDGDVEDAPAPQASAAPTKRGPKKVYAPSGRTAALV